MATADQYETHINAIRDAALTVSGDGSTVSGKDLVHVTATSTRKYVVNAYTGEGAQSRLARDFMRGVPPVAPGPSADRRADGVVLIAETSDDILICARIRK